MTSLLIIGPVSKTWMVECRAGTVVNQTIHRLFVDMALTLDVIIVINMATKPKCVWIR